MIKLEHRHGGKITAITSIEHATVGRGKDRTVHWFFRGNVTWNDGSTSVDAQIPPHCVVIDRSDAIADKQYDEVFLLMTNYLVANGNWDVRGHWKPRQEFGKTLVTFPKPGL